MIIGELFALPIGLEKLNRDFTEEEFSFINSLEFRRGRGNSYSLNSYVLESEQLKEIKSFILENIHSYLEKVDPLGPEIEIYITQSWINYTVEQEYHHSHSHANSIISGVMYFNAAEDVDSIVFENEKRQNQKIVYNNSSFNRFNSGVWKWPVKTGDLILFPSDTKHYVEIKKGDNKRISLSFNTFIKGELGNSDSLTHLHLK